MSLAVSIHVYYSLLTSTQSYSSNRHLQHPPCLCRSKGNNPPKRPQRLRHLMMTHQTISYAYGRSKNFSCATNPTPQMAPPHHHHHHTSSPPIKTKNKSLRQKRRIQQIQIFTHIHFSPTRLFPRQIPNPRVPLSFFLISFLYY